MNLLKLNLSNSVFMFCRTTHVWGSKFTDYPQANGPNEAGFGFPEFFTGNTTFQPVLHR